MEVKLGAINAFQTSLVSVGAPQTVLESDPIGNHSSLISATGNNGYLTLTKVKEMAKESGEVEENERGYRAVGVYSLIRITDVLANGFLRVSRYLSRHYYIYNCYFTFLFFLDFFFCVIICFCS